MKFSFRSLEEFSSHNYRSAVEPVACFRRVKLDDVLWLYSFLSSAIYWSKLICVFLTFLNKLELDK